ncbi:Glycosyl transferase family 8 [Musa troglodytarum]|uniref:Hexosyltransferase n=1 Tax=Musa troglodytarum TaxID=320322 RepID=A0A9E7K1W8_9LILI|nr:Glycosyl transferase family 8 [Musa troglodytarum]
MSFQNASRVHLFCLLGVTKLAGLCLSAVGREELPLFDCLGRRLGPRFLSRGGDDSMKLANELYKILDQVNSEELPVGLKVPGSFSEFLSDMKNNQYDAKTFAVRLKAMMEYMDREVKRSRLAEQLHKYFAATTIPKGMHCLSLRLTDEYSSNAQARKELPTPELLHLLSDNSYHHFVVASDNILAASVVMEYMDREVKRSRLAEQLHKYFAATTIPKGMHCLSLRLTDEYSSNAQARKELPTPELLHLLSDNSYHHFVVASDNILAASVVVTSVVRSSLQPERVVFHVITDKKTYPSMHSWFALNPLSPAIIEVKGVHQFDWLTRDNVPVLEAFENHHGVGNHYHGNHIMGVNVGDSPIIFASKLQARSSKYISLLSHLRLYLPELFPNLNKVVFLDDDVVVQHDLSPLWEIDLLGKVNGAVETCRGEDTRVMAKHFRTYFNFSHPLIANELDPDECAWAYGMNVFDLNAWRKTSIRKTYHYWVKENFRSNLTLWKFGTLPPALIAFRNYVHPIDPSWHMLGLGYQESTDLERVRKAAVIHYNGQCKPWLEIGFKHVQPFWTKHVNYLNDFIRNCHILEPQWFPQN